ncbi:helicase-exonuclease AddAB subunit AddA [Lachnospiraceae bacterium 48-33]
MKWTEEQNEVIVTRNKNILVSAAAGSGKTAVLTERILQLVMDSEHPIDIDQLVVVTFTRAAAGEMRERILKALQKKSDEYLELINHGGECMERFHYLQRQLSFIHNARITTIDSFCMDVVRENFAEINIDPAFKIGEEGELTLLRADVMAKVMEKHYEEADEDFLNFIDIYSSNRSDADVEQMISTLYQFAMSYPYPAQWIQRCAAGYEEKGALFEETDWYQALSAYLDRQIEMIRSDVEECLRIIDEADGPWAYQTAILSDKVFMDEADKAKSYEERRRLFCSYSPQALSRKKQPEADEKKKEMVKAIRDDYKKLIRGIAEKYFSKTKEEVMSDMEAVRKNIKVLSELVLDFMQEFAAAKRDKNLVDFHDLEHFALQILVEQREDGTVVPTDTALALAEDIGEIMIDEYQDSNYVQEMILMSISGAKGRNNVFMVGDVKQSIYKFRMARPELFLEKYNRFERIGEGPDRKIILSKNFRSRKTILDVTNLVFGKIMTRALGGIEYDSSNALYYGADYESEDAFVELLAADISEYEQEDSQETELENDVNAKELEAEMVALRIRELYDQHFQVKDKVTGQERDMKYSDVVLLLRSMGESGEVYERVLKSKGIPVKCPVKHGCFDSFEVKSVLEFLSIIDNPRQDIPLVAVLENIFRFTDEEIAKIKILGGCTSMYDNILAVNAAGTDSSDNAVNDVDSLNNISSEIALKEKLHKFFSLLQEYRKKKTYLTIYDLINRILEDTGFEYFISAFPDGSMRLTNIAMLKERASIYQQGSYSGLFNFIRYIEKNEQYEIVQETISGAGEENAVTIMSIHKSKGLEFPVVVVGALGKKFNNEDATKKVVLHQTYGMGMDRYDVERSMKSSTLMKRSISVQITMENLAEELRVLYVAMTRAKEKLILACSGRMKNKWAKYERLAERAKEHPFHMNQILSAGSYMDLLFMSLLEGEAHMGRPDKGYVIQVKTAEELAKTLVHSQHEEAEGKKSLDNWNTQYVYNQTMKEEIQKSFSYEYPYKEDIKLKAKVSVTDIKQRIMQMYDMEPEVTEEIQGMPQESMEVIQPRFLNIEEEAGAFSSTSRGNAYHRVFQLLDYGRDLSDYQKVQAYLDELLEKKLITEGIRKSVRNKDILNFLNSQTGKRMAYAWKNGTLKREQQFVMGIPAAMVNEGYEGEETVLVQGIIDAYFEEDGKMYVVDYKTDHVDNIKELEKRYRMQLIYYGYAVERITGKKVKDKIIYSVKFGESLKIEG